MNIFLLRWNPAISSWKDADFRKALEESRKVPIDMDWSVRSLVHDHRPFYRP